MLDIVRSNISALCTTHSIYRPITYWRTILSTKKYEYLHFLLYEKTVNLVFHLFERVAQDGRVGFYNENTQRDEKYVRARSCT